jgi:hypothetical protein
MKAVHTGALLARVSTALALHHLSDSLQTSPFRHVGLKLASARLLNPGRDRFAEHGGSRRRQFAWTHLAQEHDPNCCFLTQQKSRLHLSTHDLEYPRQACHRPAIEVPVGYSRRRRVLNGCQEGTHQLLGCAYSPW